MPAQNLHLALLPYIKKHKASCAALCKAMREKKLSIHLYLDEYTGPNAAWSYCNNSDWHFLITSDGARLVSKFTWCGTYSFGSRGGAAKCKGVYEQTTGKKWEDLSEEAQFLASQAVLLLKRPLKLIWRMTRNTGRRRSGYVNMTLKWKIFLLATMTRGSFLRKTWMS